MMNVRDEIINEVLNSVKRIVVDVVVNEQMLKSYMINQLGGLDEVREELKEHLTWLLAQGISPFVKKMQYNGKDYGADGDIIVRSWIYVISEDEFETLLNKISEVLEKGNV